MSFMQHTRRAIREGKAQVALLTYGSTAHSNAMALALGGGYGWYYTCGKLEVFAGQTLVSIRNGRPPAYA